MGRRAHRADPTSRRQVEVLAGYGVREADIACVIGVDGKTLRKHYRSELDQGHIKASAKVAENLYRKATGDGREAVIAAIFWLKTRAGWKETSVHEVSGRDGQPIATVEHNPREVAKAILAVLAKARLDTDLLPSPLYFASEEH